MNSLLKTILFTSCLGVGISGCSKENADEGKFFKNSANTNTDESYFATIEFEEKEYNFGTVTQGTMVEKTFVFKNTGSKADLTIANAQASCGCTVPEWPKEPIKPGQSGKIKVVFNTTGKAGAQRKTINITANTVPNITSISLVGEVLLAKSDSSKTQNPN